MKIRLLPAAAVLLLALLASAAEPLEEEPTFSSAELLSPQIMSSGGGDISPEVPIRGFLGRFELRTEFGLFRCLGSEMLAVRLNETQALREIEKLSRTKLFTDAAKNALVQPLESAVKIVKDPVAAAKAVPQGVSRLFGSVSKGVQAVGRTAKHTMEGTLEKRDDGEPAKREDIFGFNKSRNRWAAQFGVDPYTTNPVLARKLSDLTSMSFSTETIAGFGLGAVAAPLSMIGTVDEIVITKPPAEVRAINRSALEKLTGARQQVAAFQENRWFTPTLQTRFTKALGKLANVKHLSRALTSATQANSEEEARFYCRVVESLAAAQSEVALVELRTLGKIPAGVATVGGNVIAIPVDAIAWTEAADRFAHGVPTEAKIVIVTSAKLTDRTQQEFASRHWEVVKAP